MTGYDELCGIAGTPVDQVESDLPIDECLVIKGYVVDTVSGRPAEFDADLQVRSTRSVPGL